MKTLIFLRIIISLFLISFIGCSKDSDNSDSVLIDYGAMQAKVSGLMTIEDNTVINFEPRAIKIVDDRIFITGEIKGSYTAQLFITIPITINTSGTYTENIFASISEGWSCNPSYVGENCWYLYLYNSTKGSITITEINEKRISGFFQFKLTGSTIFPDEANITDGYFNILRE